MSHWICSLIGAVIVATSLQGCSGIRVETHHSETAATPTGDWAWLKPPGDDEFGLESQIRTAISDELVDRGLRRVAQPTADFLVEYRVDVETRTRRTDPYFSLYHMEEYEVGTLTINFIDARNGQRLWSGEGRSQIRVSGVPTSAYDATIRDPGWARKWNIRRKVDAILAELPRADVSVNVPNAGS